MVERTLSPGFLTRFNWAQDIVDGRGFAEFDDGVLKGAIMDARISMLVIRRTETELFADTVKRFLQAQPDTLAIAGCFADNHTMRAKANLGLGSGPVKPGLQDPMGFTVEGGAQTGEARPGRAFLVIDQSRKIRIGRGDPPADAVHGFSGLGAMILEGVKLPTGDPKDQGRDDFYNGQSSRGGLSGNTVVAIAPSAGLVLAAVKPHGLNLPLNDLRDSLADSGFRDAVFLDGSDSVFWNLRGTVPAHIQQGPIKNRITTQGLAFLRARVNR